ncbi:hypothetical protein EIP91_010551 [Steccherinum ochraceum]|uniref:Uncharacterized protein n=1 Tax=Steccherinum ochraceum TaxID=92696 RepID=A0A4R0R0G3_9APHY|nr:hypothetical protein EIP91_010551 [Steccherinum ochraceum]
MPMLYRRKGGGGKGAGAGGRAGSEESSVSVSGATGGRASTATAYGPGGGLVSTIPDGQPFAGKSVGGGTRDQVYGTQTYGSGYPGQNFRGVGAYPGYPYVFWPVIWPYPGYGGNYVHDSAYNSTDNSNRPGGPLVTAVFTSATSNSTFRVINCTLGNNTSAVPSLFDNSSSTAPPLPEQAIQYYRASSVVLSLDGYNDTSALSDNQTAPDVPLPSWVDLTTMDCLNSTIGQAVPLIDTSLASFTQAPPFTFKHTAGTLALLWILCSYVM